jgi:hypothetical protein
MIGGSTHLPTAVLDRYLHHTLPPSVHQQVRVHLDRCELCWQAWNRHRWDAAQASPLYRQLAAFLGAEFTSYFDSSRALAAEWAAANPRTDHDIAQFFRTSTSYLYNLAIWEASGNRPDYLTHALPILARHGTQTVLDYGCGIGSDTLALHHRGYDVIGCDFHSPSTAFLRWRSEGAIPVIEPDKLDSITEVDTLWVIDTLDHLPDIDASLGALLSAIDLVVTENLSITRGHGRQRFHYRRPFPKLTALFARHRLIPSRTTANTPIMHWTRG